MIIVCYILNEFGLNQLNEVSFAQKEVGENYKVDNQKLVKSLNNEVVIKEWKFIKTLSKFVIRMF